MIEIFFYKYNSINGSLAVKKARILALRQKTNCMPKLYTIKIEQKYLTCERVHAHKVHGQALVWDAAAQPLVQLEQEHLLHLRHAVLHQPGQVVVLLRRELVADALLFADLEHGAAGAHPQPGLLGRVGLALLQQVPAVLDDGVEHAEGLLGGHLVGFEAQQPAGHHLNSGQRLYTG